MMYLSVDSKTLARTWLSAARIATPFASQALAQATRETVADAMGVIETNGAWYVVKNPKKPDYIAKDGSFLEY